MKPPPHTVDEVLPPRDLAVFGLQHVLVMAASPITAAFLVSRALDLPSDVTVNLIAATFLVCGIGTLLQSFGPAGIGARLPFIMVPGGAPIVLFVTIAKQAGLPAATGAVLLTGAFYLVAVPLFARCLRFFPRLVIGTMLVLVAVNLISIYGGIITGRPGTPGFGDPLNLGLAGATVVFTALFVRVLPGTLSQLAVLFGLLAGAALAWVTGVMRFDAVFSGPALSLPSVFPFGWPVFDPLAALPLLLFSVVSMAEATSQTVAIAEIVGREGDAMRLVPRTILGDAAASLLGGCFGTSLIITSGENIGIVQATRVRSRFVTAAAGVILVALAFLAPLARLANAVPAPVVGGTAIIVFAIIGGMGIDMLRRVELRDNRNMFTLAVALSFGLLPILVPGIYGQFPPTLQIILGNGLAMGTLMAVLFNIVFHHFGRPAPAASGEVPHRAA
ncbi:uracil-xanthine permease family protein [Methylobacterium nonmethylotrophicum]|uniref:Uracil-xanthine permease n=1 Tax=Methylobacterium nonmethylotrophicum TaxID=1141884 RepID=A0A4Z0NFB6_9HYPH|nr:uracil-xanthine permease family protein [Methylobacterium nonmethylotrophicum]TGD94920.1 uracil-xanthine permease [Methylobacterium nonmethylotrophicum]